MTLCKRLDPISFIAKLTLPPHSNANKVRIIALYIQYREGVPEEDKRRLYQHARLTLAEQDAVNALAYLGSRVTRAPTDKDIRRKLKAKPAQDDEYDLSRFKPLLRTVLEDASSNKLDQNVFPYVKDFPTATPIAATASLRSATNSPAPTSLRSQKPAWHRAAKPGGATQENRPRMLVFVAGGMTYSEMRETYVLSNSLGKDIFIGAFLDPLYAPYCAHTVHSRFNTHRHTAAVRGRSESIGDSRHRFTSRS